VSKYEFPGPDRSVKTEDRDIGSGVKVRIYTPPNYQGGKPICVYTHGGGWAMGDLDADDPWCRIISKSAGTVLVSVDYRLTPQFKHPTQVNDCFDAYLWTVKNANELGGMEDKIWVCGASAGGHLALALALKIVEEGHGKTLQGVVAQVPVTIHPDAVPEAMKPRFTSYDEHSEDTVDTKSAMGAFWSK
jgi:versiconal hemiacetal acetate esterase